MEGRTQFNIYIIGTLEQQQQKIVPSNRKKGSRKEPIENFQEALFILLLLVGRDRS